MKHPTITAKNLSVQISKRIHGGLTCIKKNQLSDGSFLSLSADNVDVADATVHKTVFVTSLILSCLENVSGEATAKKIIRNGLQFLLHEKSRDWSWNYWPRSTNKKIPDDMDDTCAALIAIHIHQPDLITPAVLEKICNHLRQTKHLLSGLHNTWMTDYRKNDIWEDVDIVINSTIGFFMTRYGANISEISTAIEVSLEKHDESNHISQYYLSSITAWYFLSRFLGNRLRTPSFSIQKDTALTTALMLSTLIHLDTPKKKLKKYVLAILNAPWNAQGLYVESIKNNIRTYAGSEVLTAAFCIEALLKYMLYE